MKPLLVSLALACTFVSELGWASQGTRWSFKDPLNKKISWDVEINSLWKDSRLYRTTEDGVRTDIPSVFGRDSSHSSDIIRVSPYPGALHDLPALIKLRTYSLHNIYLVDVSYSNPSQYRFLDGSKVKVAKFDNKPKVNTWSFSDHYNPAWSWQIEEPVVLSTNGEPSSSPLRLRLIKTSGEVLEIPVEQNVPEYKSDMGRIVPVNISTPSPLPDEPNVPIGFSLHRTNFGARAALLRYHDFVSQVVLHPEYVSADEPAPPAKTDIRRWLFEIPRKGKSPILAGLSIFDPDGEEPALLESVIKQLDVNFSGGEHTLGMTAVDNFRIVQEENPKTKKIERAFKIIFDRLLSVKTFAPPKDENLLQPYAITMFQDGTVLVDNQERTIVKYRTYQANVENWDLKTFKVFPWNTTRQVRKLGVTYSTSFVEFFGPKGIQMNTPALPRPWTDIVHWKDLDSSPSSPTAPVKMTTPKTGKPKADVRRWTFEIPRKGLSDILVGFSIFQPDGDSVLLEYANKQTYVTPSADPHNLGPRAVNLFEIVKAKNPATKKIERAFRIGFDPQKSVIGGPFHKDVPFVLQPLSILAFQDGKVVIENQEDEKVEKRTFSARVQDFDVKSFEAFPWKIRRQVQEPGTIHPVPFRDYFGPKDIQIKTPVREISWSDIGSWDQLTLAPSRPKSSSWARPPSKSYSDANDLDLGGSLKDKKEEVWKLLQQVDKPTIAQFLELIGGVPKAGEKNPFAEYGRSFNLSGEISAIVPRLVTEFESVFPGATWYGLGRDIYLFSDILDAFYTYLGQPGKVRRLHASQPSFDEKNIDEVIGFLKTNGFDFENIGPDSKPQIFFDVTSYSHGTRYSQSSQLMRAAYQEWKRLGRNPRDLLGKVNFISTGKGTSQMPFITPSFSLKKFFKDVKFKDYGPETILRVDNSSMLQYSDAWHELYQPFETHADGTVTSAPGAPSHTELKLKLLWEMWEIVKTVMNKDFLNSANFEARYFDFEFVPCENLLSKPD